MEIVVAGGTGFVGRSVVSCLNGDHNVVVLTRNSSSKVLPCSRQLRYVQWNPADLTEWTSHVNGCHAVINLVGESVAAGRWTSRRKEEILISRIQSTRALVHSIRVATSKPSVLINASAVGYYGDIADGALTESYPKGKGFLADICEQWEREALEAEKFGVRVVLLRFGMVLGKQGGALSKMAVPFQFFLGGPIGNGQQWIPWIHLGDAVKIIRFAIDHRELLGPVNVIAPEQVTMQRFCAALGHALHRPSWLRVPEQFLKVMLGEMAGMFLGGQPVVPAKLSALGYSFQFPTLESALKEIYRSCRPH